MPAPAAPAYFIETGVSVRDPCSHDAAPRSASLSGHATPSEILTLHGVVFDILVLAPSYTADGPHAIASPPRLPAYVSISTVCGYGAGCFFFFFFFRSILPVTMSSSLVWRAAPRVLDVLDVLDVVLNGVITAVVD
jgi:hypothetical protein